MALVKIFHTNFLKLITLESSQKPKWGIPSEKFAIVTCSLLVAVFALPLLVVIHALAALVWGTTTVFQLVNGEGLFNEG